VSGTPALRTRALRVGLPTRRTGLGGPLVPGVTLRAQAVEDLVARSVEDR
jgi:hypothetical protein